MSNSGCPCTNDCCYSADVIIPNHEHDEEDDTFCTLCWTSECLNCEQSCECNL